MGDNHCCLNLGEDIRLATDGYDLPLASLIKRNGNPESWTARYESGLLLINLRKSRATIWNDRDGINWWAVSSFSNFGWNALLIFLICRMEWFYCFPYRPLRNVKNHFQSLGSMEIHNVIINFPKWVIQPNYTWEAGNHFRGRSIQNVLVLLLHLNDWHGGAASTVGVATLQLATRRAGSLWVGRATAAATQWIDQDNIFFTPSSVPLIPAFLD